MPTLLFPAIKQGKEPLSQAPVPLKLFSHFLQLSESLRAQTKRKEHQFQQFKSVLFQKTSDRWQYERKIKINCSKK